MLRPPAGARGDLQQPPVAKCRHALAQQRDLGVPAIGVGAAGEATLAAIPLVEFSGALVVVGAHRDIAIGCEYLFH